MGASSTGMNTFSGIMAAVRLPLMSMEQLLNDVRGSQLVCADAILDAIKVKNESAYVNLKHRGLLCKICHYVIIGFKAVVLF